MRILFAAVLTLAQVSAAAAQTTTPPAEAPAADAPQAATACAELPPPPAAINIAAATTTQMSAASDRQAQWRQQARDAIECRRLYYNASITRYNEINNAWSAQLDAFCARRNIRCTDRQREEAQPPTE